MEPRQNPTVADSPVALAEKLLRRVRYEEQATPVVDAIAGLEASTLAADLDSDERRLAFWINLYNAATQLAVADDPSQYESRRQFFSTPVCTVAGRELSLDDIEHGILRRGYSKLALGYLRSPFRDAFYDRYGPVRRDPRIHFALNCAAASCPPIVAYTPAKIDRHLDWATEGYLETHVEYDPSAERAVVPRVFLWFRGDWGRKPDILRFLRRYEQLPAAATPRLSYKEWDWSFTPENFADGEPAGPPPEQ